jgi:uncharacterized protein YkwD
MFNRLSHLLAATAGTALLAAAAPAAATAAPCPGADQLPRPASLREARVATLCLLNEVRVHHGLRPLHESPRLRRAAERYSRSMVAHSFFDHVSPGGSTLMSRVRATSYLRPNSAWMLGENIAWGTGRLATPAQTVDAWMHSAGHRRNILTPRFREIGIGIVVGAPVRAVAAGQAAATYTTDFGSRG